MADLDLAAFSDVVPLGSGGLGDVYRATRRSTGGQVAIKVLRDWSDHDVAWQRAQRELRALVDLRGHSNVVNVEEVIDSDGTSAIVMEYAPGGSVGDLLRAEGGTLGFGETLLVAEHTAAALAAAHDRGIIHRDIKPHNLLIGAFGQVKVCDFGIAALTRSDEVSNRTNSLSLRYASPEELRGDDEIGPAADVFSLAATVHQLLTGQYLPTPDGTAGSLPLRTWTTTDDVPADVEVEFRDLVVRSAARDPAVRPTAHDLRERFEALSVRLGPARCRALPPVSLDAPTIPGADRRTTRIVPDDSSTTSVAETAAAAAAATTPERNPAADTTTPGSATTVAGPAITTPAPAGPAPPLLPPSERNPSRVALGAFVVLLTLVGLGAAGFTLGWFDRSGDDADAATVTTTPSVDTAVTTPASVVTPATAPAATTADTFVDTSAAPDTTAPATTAPSATAPAAVPERYAGPQCPPDAPCIEMSAIGVVDGEYRIEWSADFTPSVAGTHAHFFWDVHEPAQVGSESVDRAPWELTAAQPFVPAEELRLANRPADATGICVTPADSDHAVIDPASFHCALLGPDGTWSDPGA